MKSSNSDVLQKSIEDFLNKPDWQLQIPALLGALGAAFDCQRVSIFQTFDLSGEHTASMIYEWVPDQAVSLLEDQRLQHFLLNGSHTGRLILKEDTAQQNVSLPLSVLPETLREILETQEIQSAFILPISILQKEWGFLQMDLKTSPEPFFDDETKALRMIANLLGSAIQIQENQFEMERYARRLTMLTALRHVTQSVKSLEELCSLTLNYTRQMIPFSKAGIVILDEGENEAITVSFSQQSTSPLFSHFHAMDEIPIGDHLKIPDSHPVQSIHKLKEGSPLKLLLTGPDIRWYSTFSLIIKNRLVGVLGISSQVQSTFLPDYLEIGHEIASMLSLGIQTIRLVNENDHFRQRETRLNEISQIVNSSFEVDSILQNVIRLTAGALNADAGFIRIEPCAEQPAKNFSSNLNEDLHQVILSHPDSPIYQVQSIPYPIKIDDYTTLSSSIPKLLQAKVNSLLCIPILIGGLKGAILLMRFTDRRFRKDDLLLGEAIAQRVGTAIQNAYRYQTERQRAEELEVLHATVKDISSELELPRLLNAILERAISLLNALAGEIALYDQGGQNMQIAASYNQKTNTTGSWVKPGEGMFGVIAETNEPILIKDYRTWGKRMREYDVEYWHSGIAVPLIIGKRTLGAIAAVDSDSQRQFNRNDLRILTLLAQQAAIAVENARLFEAAQQRAKEAETLQQASATLASSLRLEEAIRLILEQLSKVIPHDSASVQLLEGNDMKIVGGHGFDNDAAVIGLRFSLYSTDNPNARVIQSMKPLILEDAPSAFQQFLEPPHNHIHSWMGIPLMFRKRPIGMLALDSRETGYFNAHHARLAIAFAQQVAIAVENAHLFEEVHRFAMTDPLTGLYNRRHFFEMAREAFEFARQNESPLCIILTDLDDFKTINDTFGHLMGDTVLQNIAQRLQDCLRSSDLLGRYGGDEFVILLPNTRLDTAAQIAERLRTAVSKTILLSNNKPVSVTTSIGIAAFDATCAQLENLLDHADQAHYTAKQSGKNKTVIWRFKDEQADGSAQTEPRSALQE